MTTINTIDDLLQVVRENEAFRAAMRRELLTEELLTLPSQFAKMLETQDAMLAEQTEFRQTQIKMLKIQDAMLAEQKEMRGDIHALHRMYRRQHDDLGRFRGNYALSAMRENNFEIAQPFARLRRLRRIGIRPLPRAELNNLLDIYYEAVDALGLRESAWDTFQNPDLIAEVTGIRSADPGFYIAVEASYTGDREDALRATDHAKILRHATGKESYAVVAAVRLGPGLKSSIFNDVSRFVEARDEDAVLWHQLDEEELEPLDPC